MKSHNAQAKPDSSDRSVIGIHPSRGGFVGPDRPSVKLKEARSALRKNLGSHQAPDQSQIKTVSQIGITHLAQNCEKLS